MAVLPNEIYANFAFNISEVAGDYTPSAGFTTQLILRGADNHSFDGVFDSSNWTFTPTVAVAGVYQYSIIAIGLAGRQLLASGRIDVLRDPTLVELGADLRSHAERTLEAIEAVLEKRATTDQQSYTIAGRSITRIPIAELLTLRDRYKAEVASQRKKRPKRVLHRFSNT